MRRFLRHAPTGTVLAVLLAGLAVAVAILAPEHATADLAPPQELLQPQRPQPRAPAKTPTVSRRSTPPNAPRPPARIAIPAHNDAHLTAPAPRPPVGDAAAKARVLFDAIVHDDPARAEGFFFPADPFSVLKGIADPYGYHAVLLGHYRRDIHALHTEQPQLARAEFDRFELSRRMTWMTPRREANALPYWSCYHSQIVYRLDGRPQQLEVRVLITWDDHWYVTHLR